MAQQHCFSRTLAGLVLGGAYLISPTLAQPAESTEPDVRVLIASTLKAVEIIPQAGTWTLAPEGQDQAIPLQNEAALTFTATDSGVSLGGLSSGSKTARSYLFQPADMTSHLLVKGVPVGVGWSWESKQDRTYEGQLRVSVKEDGTLDVVVTLPVEEYLRGVVPAEIGNSSPMEALKAQAVAARSETMTALAEGNYAGPGYDICADVNCQVYSGTGTRSEATDQAIRETRGIVLTYDGKTIPAYYSSNCGGCSEDIEDVWPGRGRNIPVWSGRTDEDNPRIPDLSTEEKVAKWIASSPKAYCNPEFGKGIPDWAKRNFRWTVTTSADDLTTYVAQVKDIGRVVAIDPLDRGVSGRLKKVRFVGENGSLEVGPELEIRRIWRPFLRGSAFIVKTEGPKERPTAFVLSGAGYGHGVGMCQTGAIARASMDQDYRQILQHYYKDVEIVSAYR